MRTSPLFLAAVLFLAACDSAGPEPPGPAPASSDFVMVGAAHATSASPFVPRDLPACFTTVGDGRLRRITAARLAFRPDGTFDLRLEVRTTSNDPSTPPDTLHATGPVERHGALALLRPDPATLWLATLGPDSTRPNTVVLTDITDDDPAFLLGDHVDCRQLIFTLPGLPPKRWIQGRTEASSFALRRIWFFQDGPNTLPFIYGRLHNNRYDSAHVDLRPDGTYTFRLWHILGDPYFATYTRKTITDLEGRYLVEGDHFVFDSGAARMAYARRDGDRLIVYDTYWHLDFLYWHDAEFTRR